MVLSQATEVEHWVPLALVAAVVVAQGIHVAAVVVATCLVDSWVAVAVPLALLP